MIALSMWVANWYWFGQDASVPCLLGFSITTWKLTSISVNNARNIRVDIEIQKSQKVSSIIYYQLYKPSLFPKREKVKNVEARKWDYFSGCQGLGYQDDDEDEDGDDDDDEEEYFLFFL